MDTSGSCLVGVIRSVSSDDNMICNNCLCQGDGIFSPGGSLSNMYGMMLARHWKYPELKTKGLFGHSPLVAFTSEESHYSIVKGANWLGLGVENVVKVKTAEGKFSIRH